MNTNRWRLALFNIFGQQVRRLKYGHVTDCYNINFWPVILTTNYIILQGKIRDKNETVLLLTLQQLSTEYDSPFSSVKGTLLALQGVVGNVGAIVISKAYNAYKINKV